MSKNVVQDFPKDMNLVECLTGASSNILTIAAPTGENSEGGVVQQIPSKPPVQVALIAKWMNQNIHHIKSKNLLVSKKNDFLSTQFIRNKSQASHYDNFSYNSKFGYRSGFMSRNDLQPNRWASQLGTQKPEPGPRNYFTNQPPSAVRNVMATSQ